MITLVEELTLEWEMPFDEGITPPDVTSTRACLCTTDAAKWEVTISDAAKWEVVASDDEDCC